MMIAFVAGTAILGPERMRIRKDYSIKYAKTFNAVNTEEPCALAG